MVTAEVELALHCQAEREYHPEVTFPLVHDNASAVQAVGNPQKDNLSEFLVSGMRTVRTGFRMTNRTKHWYLSVPSRIWRNIFVWNL